MKKTSNTGLIIFLSIALIIVGFFIVRETKGNILENFNLSTKELLNKEEKFSILETYSYTILDRVELMQGGVYADILMDTMTKDSPKEDIDDVIEAIKAVEKLDQLTLYSSNEAYEANFSQSYSEKHPYALYDGLIASVSDYGLAYNTMSLPVTLAPTASPATDIQDTDMYFDFTLEEWKTTFESELSKYDSIKIEKSLETDNGFVYVIGESSICMVSIDDEKIKTFSIACASDGSKEDKLDIAIINVCFMFSITPEIPVAEMDIYLAEALKIKEYGKYDSLFVDDILYSFAIDKELGYVLHAQKHDKKD